ncbi:MAG: hypothetical protein UV73_C0012G0105 [Candidatus Gottesmanbacteria bacterium GW2011_GWA2_43_14]|uniref:Methyltransferase type 11 domain-containing protein n=1 Tax=Candidatus Gottesmanbacteria bacterium GW2011_GWA2_43_14 TaxID=1618443 RepID=A0A0G1DEN7_9BACT|nr:MAG: hypothetical protein UV73_C0012G0105 [Candidatus Gottesmanbacteria bacterium GW2011_GWA2_43_14]
MKKIIQIINRDTEKYFYKNYYGVVNDNIDFKTFVNEQLNFRGAKDKNQFLWFSKFIKLKKENTILDFGCDFGNLVILLWKKGYKVDGNEINQDIYQVLKLREKISKFKKGSFIYSNNGSVIAKKNSYDIILSYFVLVHVSEIEAYIKKSIRVLKPEGKFIFTTSNYRVGFEYYYACWLPLFSRNLSKFILGIKKKNTLFIDGLNFITPEKVESVLKEMKLTNSINVTNLGSKFFLREIFNNKIHPSVFIRYAKLFDKLHLIPLMVKLNF